jgi:YbbR domain-containing protein
LLITRNWKIKLLALVLAFLFWHMVRSEIRFTSQTSFTEEHSLKQSSGL